MKMYPINKRGQWASRYTHRFILGPDALNKAGADFTANALTQTFNLIRLTDTVGRQLYCVNYPLARLHIRALSGYDPSGKIDVGVTGNPSGLIVGSTGDISTGGNLVRLPAGTASPQSPNTGDVFLTATVTIFTGTIAGMGQHAFPGEFWIDAALESTTDDFFARQG